MQMRVLKLLETIFILVSSFSILEFLYHEYTLQLRKSGEKVCLCYTRVCITAAACRTHWHRTIVLRVGFKVALAQLCSRMPSDGVIHQIVAPVYCLLVGTLLEQVCFALRDSFHDKLEV